ncbi:MAG: ARMT1-like domain-containing protein, partial [Desulfurella sp.]
MNTVITTIDERCKDCFLKTYQRLFHTFDVDPVQRQTFHDFFQKTVRSFQHLTSPEIQRLLNREFCRMVRVDDLFAKEKAQSNAIALALYDEWKPKVLASNNPFDLALRLSIAGNIMDYGANNNFDLHQTIQKVLQATFAIDHSKLLYDKIKKAQKILYLGDNAGEIVFDKLFIETCLFDKQVYFAVK